MLGLCFCIIIFQVLNQLEAGAQKGLGTRMKTVELAIFALPVATEKDPSRDQFMSRLWSRPTPSQRVIEEIMQSPMRLTL